MSNKSIQKTLIIGVISVAVTFTCISTKIAAKKVSSTNIKHQEIDRKLTDIDVNGKMQIVKMQSALQTIKESIKR
ncbi:MAG: hypothetical protein JKY14_11225, partial [Paraglaciecola sp.]|nr:hypothetical protein [Paraglaciecola sp.]